MHRNIFECWSNVCDAGPTLGQRVVMAGLPDKIS